ncbi:MAG: exosome complex protein Rrp4 [Nanoarchaeota archaeon]|nr:exosome complex protein Rrp4 [Nanoarchaeota archaeon]MBU1269643.1 exosome complex protein Rrp4 [Nanoarchaeota archaeon]MBU1605076.1 exosome complex protein Rrp4 [Nanoarchaeota archaeon]MBU2442956.1 exosome complex protein Rrp4 [Nanoarchaeota archaeon]
MGKLLVNDKDIVVPGEIIAEGMDFLPSTGTYRHKDNILADKVGLLSVDGKVLKTIALSGKYLPSRNDTVIGRVIDILMSGWRIDINSAYTAVLPLQEASFDYIQKGADLSKFFALDDYVVGKIIRVTSQNLVDFTMKGPGLRKLYGGRIISVSPTKVPRIIGKQGSMVSMIKDTTGCKITVGQNGLIWIEGEPEQEVITVNTIRKIEREAHKNGLTEEIKSYLDKNKIEIKNKEFKKETKEEKPKEERTKKEDDESQGEQ